jgi:Kef-type K+ transport system membrane component KefB
MEIFYELTTIVLITLGVSLVMKVLKQPLIVGYIIAGILAGPYFFNAIRSTDLIELLSKMGITMLLFIVGLHMSPKVIKEVGKVSLLTGIGQVLLTGLVGLCLVLLLGIPLIPALYIAIALTFSSTIIVLKLLSDKGDVNKLYGKIAIGFLLVQDLIAAFLLIVIPSFSAQTQFSPVMTGSVLLLKGIQVSIIIYLVTKYFLPRFTRFVASSSELLFLFSLSWGFSFAAIFYWYGFSAEIGALVAGVTLSVTPFAHEIGSRLKPLRDFFIIIFFILIGSQMELAAFPRIAFPAMMLSLFVLIGNPILMIVIMHVLGYKRKTAYLTGIITAQISEFSLILVAFGFQFGHLSTDIVSLISLIGLLTIAGSTYLILYAENLYPYLEPFLKHLEFRPQTRQETKQTNNNYDIVLFGFDRVGHDFVQLFSHLKKRVLVVDVNPYLIKQMKQAGIACRYGDAEDIEFLHELPLRQIHMCVSTIPDSKTSLLLLRQVRKVNKKAIVILLSHDIHSANELYKNGASYVMLPHYLSAKHTTQMIEHIGFDRQEFEGERQKHLAYLAEHTVI